MRLYKPMIPVAAAGLLALSLAACGGSSTSNNSSDQPTSDVSNGGDTGSGKNPDAKGPVTIDGAQSGGTVTVLSYAGLNSMDPSDAYYTNTSSILSGLVTRSLTQYKYDPTTKQMVLVPDLATDLGTPNSDYTKWTFTLRDGVKWEDGSDVTIQDLAYGIDRSFDRSAFPDGANYSNTYFKNGDTYNGPISDKGKTCGCYTIKGNTITIDMAQPFPDMPYWGAFPAMGAIKESLGQNTDSYAKNVLSDGPYKFQSYTPEKSLTLVKNTNWDPSTDPARTQYPDEYDMTFNNDSQKIDQIMAADKGDAQTTLSYDDILATDLRDFDKSRLVTGPLPCTFYWAPDYRKITNKDVRLAMAYAYPYKDALTAAGAIAGVTRISGGLGENLMVPGVPGRTAFTVNEGLPGTTDTAKAKQLLQQAGQTGFTIKWLYAQDDPQSVNAMQVVKSSFAAAGFNPQPIASTVADLSTVRSDPNGPENVRSAGWCSDWPSGASWFPPVLGSTNLSKEGLGQNYAVFSEPDVDAKIKSIQTMPIDQQPAAWNELDKTITEKYFPMFTTSYGGVAQMEGSKIEGFNIDGVFGMPTWKDIWVSQ